MDWLTDNWALLSLAVPAGLTVLWAVAQLTPFDWDNKIVLVLRKLWGMVPVGEKDPKKMGKLK